MTQEEKAKRYDKAIEYAHYLINERCKEGIAVLHYGVNVERMIAWLEKRGEQKPTDKVESKFHEGEWIIHQGTENIYQVAAIIDNQYQLKYGDNYTTQYCEDVDRCTRLWDVAKDAKDGDLIYVSTEEKGIQAIFHEYKNRTIFFHCYLCSDFAQGGYMPIGSVELVYPLQKVHYKRFFEKMHEAGYEWDANKKELKKIEQKHAWSEYVEKNFNEAISYIKDTALRNWLKSIKDRCTWLPSEEQIEALKEVADEHWEPDGLDPLYTLYQDLKKLKG